MRNSIFKSEKQSMINVEQLVSIVNQCSYFTIETNLASNNWDDRLYNNTNIFSEILVIPNEVRQQFGGSAHALSFQKFFALGVLIQWEPIYIYALTNRDNQLVINLKFPDLTVMKITCFGNKQFSTPESDFCNIGINTFRDDSYIEKSYIVESGIITVLNLYRLNLTFKQKSQIRNLMNSLVGDRWEDNSCTLCYVFADNSVSYAVYNLENNTIIK